MDKFLTLRYFFTTRPDPDFQFTTLTAIAIGILFLAGFAVIIYRKKITKNEIVKKLTRRYPGQLFTFGSILLFLLLSREAGIPLASMRIWWILLAIWIIIWIIKSAIQFQKKYQERASQASLHETKNKYLPKKKKGV